MPNQLIPVGYYGREMFGNNYTTAAALTAPVQSAATTSTTGGTGLTASTAYFYVVTALTNGNETTKSNEQTVTTGAGSTNSNTITWAAVTGATAYRVYRGTTSGTYAGYYAVGAVTTYVDTGAAITTGTPSTTNKTADLGGTSQTMFKIGFNCAYIRARWGNHQTGQNGEVINGLTTVTMTASIQATADSGTPVQISFAGTTNAIQLDPGQQMISDRINGPFTAGQFITIRTYITTTAGGAFPTGPYNFSATTALIGYSGTPGANNYGQNNNLNNGLNNGSSQILTAGAASTWASSSTANSFGPTFIEGFASDNVMRPIVGLAGDSILFGLGDSSDGTVGAASRSLVGNNIPFYQLARGGEKFSTVLKPSLYSQRLILFANTTCIICEYGTNDISGVSLTAATLESYALNVYQILARYGAVIIPVTLLPRPTGSYASTTTQVVNSNNANYQAYNAWLRAPYSAGAGNSATYDAAQLGVTIPYIIDAASYIESDASNTAPNITTPNTGGYWYCGTGNNTAYTGDGVHPTTTGHLLIKPAYDGAVNAINATAPSSASAGALVSGARFFRRF